MKIKKEQFDKYYGDMHPECNNDDYLFYDNLIAYGYLVQWDDKYRWLSKKDIYKIKNEFRDIKEL